MSIENTLTDIAIVITVALACSIFLEKIRQPAILGYILAGVILGPVFGFIQNRLIVSLFAELGVLMLLFVVGMELNLRAFIKVWPLTVACVALQVIGGLAITFPLSYFFHWPLNLTLLFAFIFALSSTAIAVKMLDMIGELKTETGRLTVSVLIAQDLAIMPMILTIRSFQPDVQVETLWILLKIFLSVALLALLVWYLSQRERIHLPFLRMIVGRTDLTPLTGLAFCFGAAAIAGLSGLSAAYGAFLAGLIIGNSHERQALLDRITPIYNILMMMFFLSIGLLLDLQFVWEHVGKILIILFLITLGKTALNISILHLLRRPWTMSFLSGVVLAQLGEFSFLLASVGQEVGIVTEYGTHLIISLTVLSLTLSPLWLVMAKRLHRLAPKRAIALSHLLNLLYRREVFLVSHFYLKCKKILRRYAHPRD